MTTQKPTPLLDPIGMSEEISILKQEVRQLWKGQAELISTYKELHYDLEFEKKLSSKLVDEITLIKRAIGKLDERKEDKRFIKPISDKEGVLVNPDLQPDDNWPDNSSLGR